TVALAIELFSKFLEGAWLVVIVVPLLVLMFHRIHSTYWRIGMILGLGRRPPPPQRFRSLVVVPVGAISRLTEVGISAALSLGEEVRAVNVSFTDHADAEAEADFRRRWEDWQPQVPLITLVSAHRSLGPPIVDYLRDLEGEDSQRQVVALIPEVQANHPWLRIFFNQRGTVLSRAIRRGTANVVLCRLRFRLTALASQNAAAPLTEPGTRPSAPEESNN